MQVNNNIKVLPYLQEASFKLESVIFCLQKAGIEMKGDPFFRDFVYKLLIPLKQVNETLNKTLLESEDDIEL